MWQLAAAVFTATGVFGALELFSWYRGRVRTVDRIRWYTH